jgi:hypothetical protein
MRYVMDIFVFLAWIAVYLSLVYGIVRYRRAQACALGTHGRNEYRPEKDFGARFAIFLVGILLAAVTYLVLRSLG